MPGDIFKISKLHAKRWFFCALGILLIFVFSGKALAKPLKTSVIKAVRMERNGAIYLVNGNNLKFKLDSEDWLAFYKIPLSRVKILKPSEQNKLTDAKFIQANINNDVYYFSSGTPIKITKAAMPASGVKPNQIFLISKDHLSEILNKQIFISASPTEYEPAGALNNLTDFNSQNISDCVPDSAVGGMDGCRLYYAMSTGSFSECEKIVDEKWKSSCYSAFAGFIPQGSAICLNLKNENYRASCLTSYAVKLQDKNICARNLKITDQNFCIAGVKTVLRDNSACDLLPVGEGEKSKAGCVVMYAFINHDAAMCGKIKSSSPLYQMCLNYSKINIQTQ